MFSSQGPSRAGSRRPGQRPAAGGSGGNRLPSVSVPTPPRTPRNTNPNLPLQVASPFSGQNVSMYHTPISTPMQPLRTYAGRQHQQPTRDFAMDVDAQSEAVSYSQAGGAESTNDDAKKYANRPELSVALSAQLPRELQKVLATCDFQAEAYAGGIDHDTGFGYIVSPSTCFVWNATTAHSLYPTCYMFPMPSIATSSGNLLTPFASLVPYGTTREPGLIVASGEGELRFWDSVDTGLAGAEHFTSVQLDLVTAEFVTGLYRYENLVYVALTSNGRLFRVTITTHNGKSQLVATLFGGGGTSVFYRATTALLPFLGAQSAIPGSSEVALALAFGQRRPRQGRDVWVLTQNQLQRWSVRVDSWEQLEQQIDVRQLIGASMEQAIDIPGGMKRAAATYDFELLDVGVRSDGEILVLFSYPSPPSTSFSPVGNAYTYCVARISVKDPSRPEVQTRDVLVSDMNRDSRPATAPKMLLIDGGAAVLVQFGGAIVVASLGRTFRQTLTLKSQWNRTLGFGLTKTESQARLSEISAIIAENGVVTIQIHHQEIEDFRTDTPTNQLKATFEQAIYYGSKEENPFLFTASSSVGGNFDQAACAVSNELVTSSSVLLKPILDQRKQLLKKMELLRALILFINENGVGGHLSVSGKKSLSDDAEKIFMALTVWQYVNSNQESRGVLEYAVLNFMERIGKRGSDDVVRLFFRTKVDEFPALFRELYEFILPQTSGSRQPPSSDLRFVNRIIIIAFDAMIKHREETNALYGIPSDDRRASQWTNGQTILDIISNLFEATSLSLTELTRDTHASAQNPDRKVQLLELQDQLKHLAEMTFWVFDERIAHLQSLANDTGDDREVHSLKERFTTVRKHVAQALVTHHISSIAFGLAQKFADFRLLAHLCNDPQALKSLDGNATSEDISEAYITRYQDKFAFELYQWYTDNGQLQKLLAQDQVHPELLSQYLEKYPNPRVSWLHYLSAGDLAGAANALVATAQEDRRVVSKKAADLSGQVEFSLAKLCNLAQGSVADERTGNAFEAAALVCTKELETISTYEELRSEFSSIVQHFSAGVDANRVDPLELIAGQSKLIQSAALRAHFKRLARQILQGKTLDFEDLIDVLTLKPQDEQLINGFWDAIVALNKSKQQGLQAGRVKSALSVIWRRLLLSVDWHKVRPSQGMYDSDLSKALQGTIVFRFMLQMTGKTDYENMWLRPEGALLIPTLSEITARFPQFSDAEAQNLLQDYVDERDSLQDDINSLGLDELYDATLREVLLATGK
ncbi:hypothetical protein FRB90_010415 [Tulasnella sp. 427]|nr:hypothetical protein FRB90_010415 [Tulasnella sp. 427]